MKACLSLFALVAIGCSRADGADAQEPRFNRDVRPILSDTCFKCHGPDSQTRQADLRLDQREGLFAEGAERSIVAAGKPEESELWRRVASNDPDVQMPPPDSGKSLTAAQRETLRQWIASGASWEDHWAFVPPERPKLPDVLNAAWVRNPLDAFILAELEKRQITPSPEARPETLVRRATLDLTGLPPTPQEIDAFLQDDSPDRYERLVDRLLASPRYGEHMAVAWLDAARYADTSGYQNDGPREMWRWRDWVISAFNRGMPFDHFTIEQLAGDLLPGATLEQKIATGFNRNHRGNSEGGIIPEEFAVEYVVDRVDTTATVWLGLTVGCARCHAHKYDPITQKEYYRLFAYFNNIDEHGRAIKEGNSPPYLKSPTAAQQRRLESLDARLAAAQSAWNEVQPQLQREQTAWEATLPERPDWDWTITEGLVLRLALDGQDPTPPKPIGGEPKFVDGPHGRASEFSGAEYFDAGDVGRFGYTQPFSVSAWVRPSGTLTGGVVSRMSDDSDSDGWALHLQDGRIQVNLSKRWLDDALRVETAAPLEKDQWRHVVATYDGSRTAAGVKVYVDGEPQPLVVKLDALNQTFENDQPLRLGSTGTKHRFQGALGDVRIYDRELSEQEAAIVAAAAPSELATIAPAARTTGQAAKLREAFLATAASAPLRHAVSQLRSLEAERRVFVKSLPTTMVMQESDRPRMAHVLERGAYDRPKQSVTPGVPATLSAALQPQGDDRLALATWIVSPNHPLTSRVTVNREWQRFFGVGLVATSEDFGTQGEPPTHPELLDWLALEFVRCGWDLKRVQRMIVTSAAYRQASTVTPELLRLDPDNRLLARGPRVRLTAEMIRDQALAAAGLLEERVGGPSFFPHQPEGLWAEIATVTAYQPSPAPEQHRRSVYGYWKRTVSNPAMAAFDAPTREACVVRRSRTNTPLQALTLLNETTYFNAARHLAERALGEGGPSAEERLAYAFRLATARLPNERELEVLVQSLDKHRKRFHAQPVQAAHIAGPGRDDLVAIEFAAYASVANTILNLDEVVTRE